MQMIYVVELEKTGDGRPRIAGPQSSGVYRLNIVDCVRFKFYSSCGSSVYLFNISDQLVAELTGRRDSADDPYLVTDEWKPVVPGPINLRFTGTPLPLDSYFQADDTVVVNPTVRTSELRMLTVMPRRLGPLINWESSLEVLAVSMGYNAVHFTPCQPSGASHSSYSIRDVLDVDELLFPLEQTDSSERWDRLKSTLNKIQGVEKITDVVLNHAGSCDSWATRTPEATYCLAECPYLIGPADLDTRLAEFGESHPEYLGMDSENILRECMYRIRVVLEKFDFSAYFELDIQGSVDLWHNSREPKPTVPGLWQALQQCGTARGFKIKIDLRSQCADIVAVWRELHAIQRILAEAARQCFNSAFEAIESTNRYERLVARKLDGPLIPKYFTKLPSGDLAANNGWVINWPAGIDFASPGHHLVFMRRHVVAWGDCLKLRYGKDAIIWNVMEEYCRRIARTFDGVRLDNCHSTPISVLRRLMGVMRAENPEMIVMAELFTGEAVNDEIYEASVGIDLLVKEAMQISSCEELMSKLWRCGNRSVGELTDGGKRLLKTKASAIIYDATHDNKTCYEKFGSFRQALPLAAACAAAPCAYGSSVGFDSLATSMPSVVSKEVRTRVGDFSLLLENKELHGIMLRGYEDSRAVSVFGSWDDWEEGLDLERISDGWILPQKTARNLDLVSGKTEYKFFVTQCGWVTCDSVGLIRSAGGFVNNLYGTTGRFCDAKRELLKLHAMSGADFFSEIINGVIVAKRLDETGAGYVYLVNLGPNEDAKIELKLESEIDSLVLAMSLCQAPNSASEEIQSLTMTRFEGQIVHHWSLDALNLETIDDENLSTYKLTVPEFGVVVLKMKPNEQVERLSLVSDPPLDELQQPSDNSFALFACEAEEPVYDIPGMGKLVFAGFAGPVHAIQRFGSSEQFLASPLAENIRAGDWLFDFTVGRLQQRFPRLYSWFSTQVRPHYVASPSGLKPKFFARIFQEIVYMNIVKKLGFKEGISDLETSLRLASLQFTAHKSVAAGLPHFASGYMRCWGRDTFIAFPGLFLTTGRFSDAKNILIAFARVVRHGLIPNLFDDGLNPRYNSRDACWCFLNALRRYIEVSGDRDILTESVKLKYPGRAFSNTWIQIEGDSCSLITVVEGILMSHYKGIDFVEENAGPKIDEYMTERGFRVTVRVDDSGLVVGGNEWNCGTWMDKMGSAEGVNRGIPATSRFGANIEINGLALAVLKFFKDKVNGAVSSQISQWYSLLASSWDRAFWNEHTGWYSDTVHGDPKGGKLRPNGLVALSQIPMEAIDVLHAKNYIEKCEESLLGPIGMRTLAAEDPDYNGWYDNSDSTCGYNYHNGPEWVWLTGHYLIAAKRFGAGDTNAVIERLDAFVKKNSGPWMSLPELTNANGAFCRDSCPSQAWSVCCVLEALGQK